MRRPRSLLAVGAATVLLAACSTDAGAPAGAPSAAPGEVHFEELELTGEDVVTPQTRLEDVHVTARDVTLAESGTTAGEMELDGLVPFAVVAEQIGDDVALERAGDSRVRITRQVRVLGRQVALSGTGEVTVESGEVVVDPASVEVGGPAWLEGLLGNAARRLVRIRQPVEGLPENLRLRRVEVVDDGFQVYLTGEDVTFAP